MRSSHSARIVAVREIPFDQLASLPQQALAIGSLHSPPVGIDRLLLLGFAFPMSVPGLLLLRDVGPHFRTLQIHYHRSTVVALVGDHLLDALQVCLRFLARLFCPDQLRHVFTSLRESFHPRGGVSRLPFLYRSRPHRTCLHIHGVLGFVRQVRSPIFHLGNPRIFVMRIHPILVFLRFRSRRARSSLVGVSIPDSWASPFRKSS